MNEIFDKIYCINLDNRVDRWKKSNIFFTENMINVERFSAIKNSNGALGCALSHTEIIKIAKQQNFKNVLIFEDDFNFINYDYKIIKDSFNELPEDWDIFYLGFNPTEKLINYSQNLYKINGAWCLHAYAVNYKFYDYILNNFVLPIDMLHKNAQKKYNFYGIKNVICTQRNEYSDIQNSFCNNQDVILESFRAYL